MKTMKYLLMTLFVLVMGVSVSSCKDKDKEEDIPVISGLVGTWGTDSANPKDEQTFTFNADGTGVLMDEDGSVNFEYTYSQKNETLLLMYKGHSSATEYTVQITGSVLTLSTGNTYIKLKRK